MRIIPSSDHGYYVDLQRTDNGDLKIVLTENGRANFGAIEEERDSHGINAALFALLEDHLCNGWEMVPPEDLGALTAAPILSDEIVRDQHGTLVDAGRVYWYPDYAVLDEMEEIRTKSAIVFQGVA